MAYLPGSIVTCSGYGSSVGVVLSVSPDGLTYQVGLDLQVVNADRIMCADQAAVPAANVTLVTAPAADPGGGALIAT